MTLPKKGLRNIIVNNIKYKWNAKGGDDIIHLSIIPYTNQSQVLSCSFEYHSKKISTTIIETAIEISHLKQQTQITNYIVRQVILFAINNGWSDNEREVNLGKMDNKINWRINN